MSSSSKVRRSMSGTCSRRVNVSRSKRRNISRRRSRGSRIGGGGGGLTVVLGVQIQGGRVAVQVVVV